MSPGGLVYKLVGSGLWADPILPGGGGPPGLYVYRRFSNTGLYYWDGAVWAERASIPTGFVEYIVSPTGSPSILLIGDYTDAWRSTDSGDTWSIITHPNAGPINSICADLAGDLWMGCPDAAAGTYEVFRSTDQGATWTHFTGLAGEVAAGWCDVAILEADGSAFKKVAFTCGASPGNSRVATTSMPGGGSFAFFGEWLEDSGVQLAYMLGSKSLIAFGLNAADPTTWTVGRMVQDPAGGGHVATLITPPAPVLNLAQPIIALSAFDSINVGARYINSGGTDHGRGLRSVGNTQLALTAVDDPRLVTGKFSMSHGICRDPVTGTMFLCGNYDTSGPTELPHMFSSVDDGVTWDVMPDVPGPTGPSDWLACCWFAT